MKKNPSSQSGSFNPRVFAAFMLSSAGVFLALASFAMPQEETTQLEASSGGARIYVTNTTQKIGPIGTGGCSLEEAIYSAVLHDSLDGGAHGIAIDATDPDHFITTECVMGTGNGDVIVLPSGADFQLKSALDNPSSPLGVDAYNYMGPTATPMIYSAVTIEAYGATLEWVGQGSSRLFAIGQATVRTPNGTASGTGNLTIRNAYIKGFHVKGGDGGGGGLGAGGAIFVQNATLVIETSTFDSNSATGGNSGNSSDLRDGGGGMGGNGGQRPNSAAGGGGGVRGNGGDSGSHAGGGGGGTIFNGGNGASNHGGAGGFNCGGAGGGNGSDGHNAPCAGGGGGGGDNFEHGGTVTYDGGNGNYGGGGGGSGYARAGSGGFGGGGGAGGGEGGNGGFGAGGGSCTGVDTSCTPGKGGAFGGNASNDSGGGGAALGGAIFNDSGSVTIHNSTFTANSVSAGLASAATANDGVDAGAAIFSRNGSLSIVNATISGNKSTVTTNGGGVVVHSDGAAANFTLDDTIIANNGTNECYVGTGVSMNGAGNLIVSNGSGSFGACPGVVATLDPQLGALQPPSVDGKYTPTMPIPLYSSAMGVADSATSLPYDQRFADRPQPDSQGRNGYDIGAFTVCRRYLVGLRYWSCSETHIPPPPQQESLMMQASPGADGTTNPVPGTYSEDVNSVIAIQAIPNSGYHFINWAGNVADPNNPSTTIAMNQPQTVTANFASGGTSADLQVTVSDGKTSAIAGAQNTYTIVVTNTGPGYVSGAVIKDTFPSIFTGVTYSATETGGAFGYTVSGSGNINDTVTLPSGSSITYKATGKLNAAATGTVSDKASVTLPSGITDPNTSNNSGTDTDPIAIKADLKVTVTDGRTSALPGSSNTYTIVVTNVGPSKVIGAVVHDVFPGIFTGVTYSASQSGGAAGFTASGSGNINNTVTMPPASTITYKATGTISASATGSISDTATVGVPTGVTDPNLGNNGATDTDML